MIRFLCFVLFSVQLEGASKVSVMETAFGLRCSPVSLKLAKEAGYAGVQIHTGNLDKEGQLTISRPDVQRSFLEARSKENVKIVSLCAGAMNRIPVWKLGKERDRGLAIMTQSIQACSVFGCDLLLFPFFGPSNFQEDEAIINGVAEFIREILPIAREHGVTIGIESPATYDRVLELFELLDNPYDVQMYYDTGNMLRGGENIIDALKTLSSSRICEIHLKPKDGFNFGSGGTDLQKLAEVLDAIDYDKQLVFEQGGGVEKNSSVLAAENLRGINRLISLRKPSPLENDLPSLSVPVSDIIVPDDLEVTLWAKSPMLRNPTNMDTDAAGRIWVAEGVNYRRKIHQRAGDRIVVLEDTDKDGKADSSHTFVQDPELISPLGISVFDNKIVVAQPPHVLVYTDVNRDLRFDPQIDRREEFLSGFNARNHDHSLHAVVPGPDGSWYLNQGNCGARVTDKDERTFFFGGAYYRNGAGNPEWFNNPTQYAGKQSADGNVYNGGFAARIQADGTGLQVVGHGFRNSYELCLSSFGDIYQNDNDDRLSCRVTWLMEGGNLGYYSENGRRSWPTDRRPGQATERAHWRQDDPGILPAGDVYGGGSPTGIAFYENGALPEEYGGMLLSCEPRSRVVFRYHPILSSGTAGVSLRKNADLLQSKSNLNFRPSDIMVGADGALYLADWYDTKVGGHRADDPTHSGAIYRIAPRGFTPDLPKLTGNSLNDATLLLQNPSPSVRYAGFQTLKAAGKEALPHVKKILKNPNPWVRARAVWLLPWLGDQGSELCQKSLGDSDPKKRLLAFRALRAANHDVFELAKKLVKDPSRTIRREIALALRDLDSRRKLPLVLELFQTAGEGDRYYLEACGLAAEDIEEEVWLSLNQAQGQTALKWGKDHSWITWRLHTKAAVPDLIVRAKSGDLSLEYRKLAMTALAFSETKEAVEALIDLASGKSPLAPEAANWLIGKGLDKWSEHGVREALKKRGIYDPETVAIQPIRIPPSPPTSLPPPSELAKRQGDAVAGKLQAARCFMCHVIDGQGVNYGPELLDWVSDQGREAFFRAVIDPSEGIAHGFTGRRLTLHSGEIVEGIVFGSGDPVVIESTGGVTQLIPRDRIKSSKAMWKQSLMLSADQLGFNAKDLVDLASYLESYRSK